MGSRKGQVPTVQRFSRCFDWYSERRQEACCGFSNKPALDHRRFTAVAITLQVCQF